MIENYGFNIIDSDKSDSDFLPQLATLLQSKDGIFSNLKKSVRNFPKTILQMTKSPSKEEAFDGCSSGSFRSVKSSIKFLNRYVNTSDLVKFTPKLSDRVDSHNYFPPFHNNPLNPTYQMCFKNTFREYLKKNLSTPAATIHKYFVEEENLELAENPYDIFCDSHNCETVEVSPGKVFNQKSDQISRRRRSLKLSENNNPHYNSQNIQQIPSSLNVDSTNKISDKESMNVREEPNEKDLRCRSVQKFKTILRGLLAENPDNNRFIIVDDEHVYAPDFIRYVNVNDVSQIFQLVHIQS